MLATPRLRSQLARSRDTASNALVARVSISSSAVITFALRLRFAGALGVLGELPAAATVLEEAACSWEAAVSGAISTAQIARGKISDRVAGAFMNFLLGMGILPAGLIPAGPITWMPYETVRLLG